MKRAKLSVVAHVFLVRSGSVLLVRRSDTGFEDGNYGPVGGHLEEGESIRQTAIRECREEIGVEIELTFSKIYGIMPENHINTDKLFCENQTQT
jgi:8-oxo-dGTP diphosphatase